MGFFQRLFGALGMSSKACKILVVGLDDAGKTTIMNKIMPKKVRADGCPARFACARAAAVPAVLLCPRATLSADFSSVRAAPVQRGGADGGVQDRAVREEQYLLHDVRHVGCQHAP